MPGPGAFEGVSKHHHSPQHNYDPGSRPGCLRHIIGLIVIGGVGYLILMLINWLF